jgi:hypothetical protein
MVQFDSKQFEIKREDQAVATWKGPKDSGTISQLLALFLREKWKGEFIVSFPGNGGIGNVVFTERKVRRIAEDREDTPY